MKILIILFSVWHPNPADYHENWSHQQFKTITTRERVAAAGSKCYTNKFKHERLQQKLRTLRQPKWDNDIDKENSKKNTKKAI